HIVDARGHAAEQVEARIAVAPHGVQRVREAEQHDTGTAADEEPEQRTEHGIVAVFEQRFRPGLGEVRFAGVQGVAADDARRQAAGRIEIAAHERRVDRQRVVAQAAQADAQVQQQRVDGRAGVRAREPGQRAQRQHGEHPREQAARNARAPPVEPTLQRGRQPAEADERMPAPRFAQQQVEQHAGDERQRERRGRQAAQHGAPFSTSGRPAATNSTRSQRAATSWFRRPASSTNARDTAP
ncbi:conserved hypothetical protein, partial [Ricinus communis]